MENLLLPSPSITLITVFMSKSLSRSSLPSSLAGDPMSNSNRKSSSWLLQSGSCKLSDWSRWLRSGSDEHLHLGLRSRDEEMDVDMDSLSLKKGRLVEKGGKVVPGAGPSRKASFCLRIHFPQKSFIPAVFALCIVCKGIWVNVRLILCALA